MGSTGSATTTSTYSPPAEVLQNYQNVVKLAAQAQQQPFTPYGGEMVAGLSPTQIAGIQNVNAAVGQADPYFLGAQNLQQAALGTAGKAQAGALGIDTAALQGIQRAQQQGAAYNQAATQNAANILGSASPYLQENAALQRQGYGQEQAYQQAATQNIANAMASAAPYMQQMAGLTGAGLAQGQNYLQGATGLTQQAINVGNQYAQQAQPFYTGALQAATPLNQAAQNYLGLGAQNVYAQPLNYSTYMNPYMSNVVQAQQALMNQQNLQQQAALQGSAIGAGAFGGDRAGIAMSNLMQQQDLANQATLSNLLQSGYNQAQQVAAQQQGVGLAAAQANRAAQQQAAGQAAALGQQQYGQQLGLGQALAALGQQQYLQNLGTGAQIGSLGQQGFGQNLQAGAQLGNVGQQLFGQNITQGQALSGLGAQALQSAQSTGTNLGNIGMNYANLNNMQAQELAAIGQQQFAQGLAGSQAAAGIGQNIYGMGSNLAGLQQQGGLNVGNLATARQQAALQGGQAQLAAGAQQQATQQAIDQAYYNQFLQQQAYPFQTTQYLANIVEGIGAGSGGTSATTAPGPSVASTLFGGLGALATISDPRMKENMHPVGETYDGQKIYKFNYKGDPRTQIGLNAAETEHHMPEAVSKTIDGIRGVDYDVATRDAAERGHFNMGGLASMGGAVHPSMAREPFALGGSGSLGDIPYIDFSTGLSYVPGVKTIGGKSTIPSAPKPYEDTSMQQLQQQLQQIKGYGSSGKGLFASGGLFGAGGLLGPAAQGSYGFATGNEPGFASGGVVGREHHDGSEGNVVGQGGSDQASGVMSSLYNTALDVGINPRDFTALGNEGSYNPKAIGDDGSSFTDLQLHIGGLSPKYPHRGAGDIMYEKANPDKLDASPQDRAKWLQSQSMDDVHNFAANYIKDNGASAWTYARQKGLFGLQPEQAAQQQGLGAAQQDQGQMSLLESALGRRLDPDTKSALLTGFLGTMASTSPFFGVAVGQGGLAAMANYMQQKQAEREYALGQQRMGLEQQRVGYEGQRVDNERTARGLEVMKFWVGNYQPVATPQGIMYKEISSGKLLTPQEYQSALSPVLSKYGLSPNDVGLSQTVTPSKNAADQNQAANLPPVATQPDTHQPDTILTADAYKNVQPDYNPILLRQKARQEETTAINAQNAGLKDQQVAADARAKNYRDMASAIENGEKQVTFNDGTTGFVPEALANLQKKKSAEKFAEEQATTQTEFNKKATTYLEQYDKAKQQIDLLSNIYSKVETNRFADARADLAGLMRELGIDKLAGMDVSQIQSANDAAVKAATTEAFTTMRDAAAKAPATGLREALLTVASPTLAPGARYQLVTNNLAESMRDKQMYEDWITAGKPDKDQFMVQWKKEPTHSMGVYQQQAVDQTPLFKGMSKSEIDLLMKKPQSELAPKMPSVPKSLFGKQGVQWSPSTQRWYIGNQAYDVSGNPIQ